jgi:excisionase family DNA binding protein
VSLDQAQAPPRELDDSLAAAVPVLLSVSSVSRILGCSPRTVRRRIASGELPAVIEHGRKKVRGDELRAYIDHLERVRARPSRPPSARPRRYDFLRQTLHGK